MIILVMLWAKIKTPSLWPEEASYSEPVVLNIFTRGTLYWLKNILEATIYC
jgi:hypothetical protein